MKTVVKRSVKAVMPHGMVLAYRRYRPKIEQKRSQRTSIKEVDDKVKEILTGAKCIKSKKEPRIIVSLTSYGDRLKRTTPIAVASLLSQKTMPDKIILWLAHGDKPTRSLKGMTKLGLEIEYCKDIKSYKKLIPTLEKYPKSVIITADDDVLYPEDWLKKIIYTYKKNPNTIIAHRARKIISVNGKIAPYLDWPLLKENIRNHHQILPNGVGGVLYPPDSFSEQVFNEEVFMDIAPHGDDLWFWAMTELKGAKRMVINNGYQDIPDFNLDGNGLWNTLNSNDGNDIQFVKILEHFPKLRKKIGVSVEQQGMTGLRFDPEKIKTHEEGILFSKHKFAYMYAKQQVEPGKAFKILDYGCGDGYGSDYLAEKLPKAQVYGTDIDNESIKEAKNKYRRKNLSFINMDRLEKYDLIVSYQVIEHVENVEEYLKFLRTLLKKNGKIIISTPDRRYRLNDDQEPWNPYHLREYTKESLLSDVKKVFPYSHVLQLTGEKNMLQIEYRRVAPNRKDKSIYGGEEPKEPKRAYMPEDFYLTDRDTVDSVDLFAVITNDFPGSETYWENRYIQGGNSGAGSYNNLAEFKAEVINGFIKKNDIKTIIELGSGDGNQLLLAEYPHYVGYDVSKRAVEISNEMFKEDNSKKFYTLDKLGNKKADLTMSLDVLFHLTEMEVFQEHILSLFKASTKFVIIYARDDDKYRTAEHVKSRNFTKYIKNNITGWKLIKHIPNKYPYDENKIGYTSPSDFYIYELVDKNS